MRLFVLCGLGMLAAGPLACTGPGLEPPGSENNSAGDHQDAGDFGNSDGAASGGRDGDGDAASGGTQAVPPLAGGVGGVGGGAAGGAGGMSAGAGDQDSGVIEPDEDAGVDPTEMNP